MAVSPFLSPARPAWRRPVGIATVIVIVLAVVGAFVWHSLSRADSKPFVPLGSGSPALPPGVNAAKVDATFKACLNEQARKQANGAQVYNVVVTGYATDSLIYSKTWSVGCLQNQNNTGGTTPQAAEIDTQWIQGAASIDIRASQDRVPYMTVPGYDVIGGRVPRGITKVTITIHAKTATVPVLNGTYLARINRDSLFKDANQREQARAVVRTFDAAGRQVGAYDSARKTHRCVLTPGGKRIDDPIQHYPGPCITATRWN